MEEKKTQRKEPARDDLAKVSPFPLLPSGTKDDAMQYKFPTGPHTYCGERKHCKKALEKYRNRIHLQLYKQLFFLGYYPLHLK